MTCAVLPGRAVGTILTGWLFAAVGARVTFALFAGAGFTVAAVYALLHRCVFTDPSPPGCDRGTASAGKNAVLSGGRCEKAADVGGDGAVGGGSEAGRFLCVVYVRLLSVSSYVYVRRSRSCEDSC